MTESDYRHWAKVYAEEAIAKYPGKQVVCTGWSPSGVYHIGNSREAVTCNAIHSEIVNLKNESEFIFVVDDYDPLDKIPSELSKFKKDLRPYLGHPLIEVPDFTGTHENYSTYFSSKAMEALLDWDFKVKFINASDLYKQGKYDPFLQLYVENEEKLQNVIERVSGSPLDSVLSLTCGKCGNAKTTKITAFLKDNIVKYRCEHNKQYRGCDHIGEIDLIDHQWKLKWRLDWPSRQSFLGVTVEPSGKDHSVAGGSVDSALAIHEEIFGKTPPMLLRYGFITLKGKKFSGSRGGALPANQVTSIMPASAYLFLVYRSDLLKDVSFNPQSQEFPRLIDEYDIARRMNLGEKFERREREADKLITAAQLAMRQDEIGVEPAMMKFQEFSLIYQSSLRDEIKVIEKLKTLDKFPNQSSIDETKARIPLLEKWLENFAPDEFKFTLLEENPSDIKSYWTKAIKELWLSSLNKITETLNHDEFTSHLRENGKLKELNPKEYYSAFYHLLLGKSTGPNATNLVFAIGKNDLINRINKI